MALCPQRLHGAHPALCKTGPGKYQKQQEGGRAASGNILNRAQQKGGCPSLQMAAHPASPIPGLSLLGGPGERWKVQTQTCYCPLGHPGLTFQLVGLLSLCWAQPALLHPEGCCPPGEGHFGPYLRDSAAAVNEGTTVGQVSGLGLCPFGCYVHASGRQLTQGL